MASSSQGCVEKGDTDLFSKGAQLFGITEEACGLAAGATPVLVEGPLDAIAVTLAAGSTAVGVAPLGTALTDRQADQLRRYLGAGKPRGDRRDRRRCSWPAGRSPGVLAAHLPRGQPRHLIMADGQDPDVILQADGRQALRDALANAPALARTLIDAWVAQYTDRMQHVEGPLLAVQSAAEVIGAPPPRALARTHHPPQYPRPDQPRAIPPGGPGLHRRGTSSRPSRGAHIDSPSFRSQLSPGQ